MSDLPLDLLQRHAAHAGYALADKAWFNSTADFEQFVMIVERQC